MSAGTGKTQSWVESCAESTHVVRASVKKGSERHPELDNSIWKSKKLNLKLDLIFLRLEKNEDWAVWREMVDWVLSRQAAKHML